MADETKDLETQEIEKSAETKAVITDDTHVGVEDVGRKSTIQRIAEILRGKPKAEPTEGVEEKSEDAAEEVESTEVVEETPESEDVEGETTEDEPKHTDEYEEIDPRFVDAARRYGWSDDRIVQYAESHDDRDCVMLTSMMESGALPDKETATEETSRTADYAGALKQLEASEGIDDLTKQVLKSLVTDLQNTKAQLKSIQVVQGEATKTNDQQEWLSRLRAADEQLDNASKEFKELGVAKTLKRMPDGSLNPNDPAVQAREEVFKMAIVLFKSGSSWDKSVRDSLRWYKGGREDVVETNVLKKIKANERRITPQREQRHQTKSYTSEVEEKASVVNRALSKYGVELPE